MEEEGPDALEVDQKKKKEDEEEDQEKGGQALGHFSYHVPSSFFDFAHFFKDA